MPAGQAPLYLSVPDIINHTYLLSKIATDETPCHQIIEQYILITEIAVVTVAYGATFVCYLLVP